MTNALLSWDDLDDEDQPLKSAINQDAALRAAESIKNLDTSEAEKELDQKQESISHTKALQASGLTPPGYASQPLMNPGANYTQLELKAKNQDMLIRAREVIARMDSELENGGRVNVAEKYLLNCQADLNQLVPFKYSLPWELYLYSCGNHWMPAELGLDKAAEEFKTIRAGTPHKFLMRFYTNYKYREHLFNGEHLLRCYKDITNPECRQYILRQAFELCTIRHTLSDLDELFGPNRFEIFDGGNKLIASAKDQWVIDEYSFKNRSKLIKELTGELSDFSISTAGVEGVQRFLETMLYAYCYTNWTMNIVVMYQLHQAIERQGKGTNLQILIKNLLKDIQAQTAFATMFISTAIQENPGVLTQEFIDRILTNVNRTINCEEDLASTLANTDTEYADVIALVKKYTYDFLNNAGIPVGSDNYVNKNNLWFVTLVSELQPKLTGEASLSGKGSTGGTLDGW